MKKDLHYFHYPGKVLENASFVIALLPDMVDKNVLVGTVLRNVCCFRENEKEKQELIAQVKKERIKIAEVPYEDQYSINKDFSKNQRYNALPIRPMKDIIGKYKGLAKVAEIKYNELKKQGINYWRNIRGDGNCYYRSVGYGYFELIIKKGPEYIQALIKL